MTITPPIHVQVTQTNISEGARKDACKCPVALAIREQCPGTRVAIAHNIAFIDGVVHRLSEVVILFVENFDRGHKNLAPFEFDLRP